MPDMWSVSDLNRYVKQSLEMDYRLQDLRITGEISGFKAYPSGHWYFTLKDSGAQVSCVMWRGRAERSRFRPRDGDAVIAAGAVTLYEVRGQYQLDVALLQPTGEGVLFQEFLRLKAQLELEGLFDAERKRPLPAFPRRVALVTSPAGAALRDMLNILRRRCPVIEVILVPSVGPGPRRPAADRRRPARRRRPLARRHHPGPRRRLARRFVVLQRRDGQPRHRRLPGAGRQRRGPRDRFHPVGFRRRSARPHPLGRGRAGGPRCRPAPGPGRRPVRPAGRRAGRHPARPALGAGPAANPPARPVAPGPTARRPAARGRPGRPRCRRPQLPGVA